MEAAAAAMAASMDALNAAELQQTATMTAASSPSPTSPSASSLISPITPTTTATPPPSSSSSSSTSHMPSIYLLDLQHNSNNTIAPMIDSESNTQLTPCPICTRTFNPVTLRKHVGICESLANKKRNIFDSSRQRREGTELAAYPLPKNFSLPAAKQERGQSPKPQHVASPILTRKKSSDELTRSTARASMRKQSVSSNSGGGVGAVGGGAGGIATPTATAITAPAKTSAPASNFTRDRMRSSERSLAKRIQQPPAAEQCPHCERCFGLKAYDRHVEWCKEKAIQASIKHGTKNEDSIAKARLEARTKYRAPCLKTKRSINRDKYSGFAGDDNESTDSPKAFNTNNNNNSIMSLSMTSSMTSERNSTINIGNDMSKNRRGSSNESIKASAQQVTKTPSQDSFQDFRLTGEKLNTYGKKKKTRKEISNLSGDMPKAKDHRRSPLEQKIMKNVNGFNDNQEHKMKETNRSNDLSTSLTYCSMVNTSTTATISPTNSNSIISTSNNSNSKRKLKAKQKSATNITQQPMENINVPSVAATSPHKLKPSISDDLRTTIMPCISLPHIQTHTFTNTRLLDMPMLPILVKTTKTVAAHSSTSSTSLHTKLDTNPIKSLAICRPKKKKLVRQTTSSTHATPLKALPSLLKESIAMFGTPMRVAMGCNAELDGGSDDIDYDKEIQVIKAPPKSKSPPHVLLRDRSFILSGFLDKYDPFLSAKRQLEDLCSSSPPSNAAQTPLQPITSTPSTPIAGVLPSKMTTSLTLSTSTPNSASPLTPHNSQSRATVAPPAMVKSTSNFRRTSSLRGPRRSPMLASRPLFAQKHRPTIQRGLSDEGPISTNFLKPEEYDEMPVRSVCVNDYAITSSPRVVRRDTSASNRKHSLKINVNANNNVGNVAAAAGTANSSDERLATTASKYLSKTDSLAVFLKYENELEKQLNQPNQTLALKPLVQHSAPNSPNPNVATQPTTHSPLVITKELKDKSNTLSKQNSAKSIKSDTAMESPKVISEQDTKSTLIHLPTPVVNHSSLNINATDKSSPPINNENLNHTNKLGPMRLEPISKLNTSHSKPNTPSSAAAGKSALPVFTTYLPAVNQPVNLNAIFGEPKSQAPLLFSKDHSYIDPKLINKCDNLPVSLNSGRALKKSSTDSSEHHRNMSSSSSDSSAPTSASAHPISQLTKLLPLTKPATDNITSPPAIIANTNTFNGTTATATGTTTQPQPITPSSNQQQQRNSTDGRNFLKRKMRLGRNQFLYDASPEADSCSADDEANRSSVEYDERPTFNQSFNTPQHAHAHLHAQRTATLPSSFPETPHGPPIVPPLPIFDDFDFEEFLSSFENDDEQFPLFKDCREFLLNRTSNKQRSTLTPNSNSNITTNNNNNNNNNNNSRPQRQHQQHSPIQSFPSQTHFEFPSLISKHHPYPQFLLTPSSLRSDSILTRKDLQQRQQQQQQQQSSNQYEELKSPSSQSNDEFCNAPDDEQRKREIFISIETEQNDLGRSPISPDSLRSMVGNTQTMVEVEVDACDNKFSKISDDDDDAGLPSPAPPSASNMLRSPFNNHLPNVQLNNAKNLIQKMQEDFRQIGEEVGANIRQTVNSANVPVNLCPASMLYADNGEVGIGVGGSGSGMSFGAGPIRSVGGPSTNESTGMPSVDACVDSDDMSSLDGYPISSQSSRRGVGSKMSADSAYGSLSRQRSSELSHQRSQSRARPPTANTATNTALPTPTIDPTTQHQLLQQQQQLAQHKQLAQQKQLQQQQQQQQQQQPHYKYSTMQGRPRQFSGSSSGSGSDNSLPPIQQQQLQQKQLHKQQQQQQQLSQLYNNNNNNGRYGSNNNNLESPLSSPTGIASTTLATSTSMTAVNNLNSSMISNSNMLLSNSSSSSNTAMSTNMSKMSKFCHECGNKFVVEHAKFCMDCGVKRLVL